MAAQPRTDASRNILKAIAKFGGDVAITPRAIATIEFQARGGVGEPPPGSEPTTPSGTRLSAAIAKFGLGSRSPSGYGKGNVGVPPEALIAIEDEASAGQTA
jgi:hypothetical protein